MAMTDLQSFNIETRNLSNIRDPFPSEEFVWNLASVIFMNILRVDY